MNYQQFLKGYIDKSYDFQRNAALFIDNYNKATFSIPTGCGKSRIIYTDILKKRLLEKKIFAISSHRLMLNSQHLNSMFHQFEPLIGEVGYIFVGSDEFKLKVRNKTKQRFNRLLKNKGLNYKDVISSTTSNKEIIDLIKNHIENNRIVVIITTYHSLERLKNIDINTIYCDEAHMLASQDLFSVFKKNFESITFDKSYFFTATTKDSSDDETNAFLMNNKEIFGERFELKFKEAVDMGLIVKPIIHTAIPTNYDNTKKFGSINNYYRFVKEVFLKHKKWVKKNSAEPDKISAKLLVKAPTVDEMWDILEKLENDNDLSNVTVSAGASRNDYGSELHRLGKKGIRDRYEYLEIIQKLKYTDEAIILHVDTFSEGIDVPGLTGVMFLNDNLPTLPKILQNMGRTTRLHDIDRERLKNNEISVHDYSKWIKPECAVILPIISVEGKYAVDQISDLIKNLRDRYGFDASYIVSEGDDMAKGKNEDEDPDLNKKDKKNSKDIIAAIKQEIERLDALDNMSAFIKKADKCMTEEDMDLLLEQELYN